jgi:hypothetical protein
MGKKPLSKHFCNQLKNLPAFFAVGKASIIHTNHCQKSNSAQWGDPLDRPMRTQRTSEGLQVSINTQT